MGRFFFGLILFLFVLSLLVQNGAGLTFAFGASKPLVIGLQVNNHLAAPTVESVAFTSIEEELLYIIEVKGSVNQPGAEVFSIFSAPDFKFQETIFPDSTGHWSYSITLLSFEGPYDLLLQARFLAENKNIVSDSLNLSF